MELLLIIFLLIEILQLHNLEGSKAEKLQLRVLCEKANPRREIKIVLDVIYKKNDEQFQTVHQNIKNGHAFNIFVSKNVDQDKYILRFYVLTNPMDNEFVNDKNPADNRPYIVDNFAIDDIRSMLRTAEVVLFKPNFSTRFVINLGSADPPELLYWNRRIFVDAKNDSGNYHAFLYAIVNKNRRKSNSKDEKVLLGYAPFVKMGDENASTSQQQQFTEYQISIPVNLTRFFKHKILLLDMVIYQYEESIYFINKLSNSKEPHEDKTCSICLDNIEIEEKIVKLHGENGNNLMHIFHSNCINTWFERLEKLICPFCKQEPKNIMSISFPPIFDVSSKLFPNWNMNPVAELFRIANGHESEENNFKRSQAGHAIKEILHFLNEIVEKLKHLLRENEFHNIIPMLDETFFELGAKGFVENPIVENIRKKFEKIAINQQNLQENIIMAKKVLCKIRLFRIVPISYANHAVENLKIIFEEKEPKTFQNKKSLNKPLS